MREKLSNTWITAILTPLIFLNVFGGIISGIWLALLGNWGAIGRGFLLAIGAIILISIAMLPSFLFAAPASHYSDKGNLYGFAIFQCLNLIYTFMLITVWCLVILVAFLSNANSKDYIPLLFWSYGIATSPWAYLSSKEDNIYSALHTILIQIAYFTIIMLIIFARIAISSAAIVFIYFMIGGFVVMAIVSIVLQIQQQKYLRDRDTST